MRFTRIELRNWRNFLSVNVPLGERVFLVGPNGSGKSNFLDAFRFLHDVADPQGGLQPALARRGGVGELRSVHAPATAEVAVEVQAVLPAGGTRDPWTYRLELEQDEAGRPRLRREVVLHGGEPVLERPDAADRSDPGRLTETHLEQVSTNRAFRCLREGFAGIRYLHIVPQLVREPERWRAREPDPYGGDFFERIARLPQPTIDARLRKILAALEAAVPQLAEIELVRDADGSAHLHSRSASWRGETWHSEEKLSDGTLRLLGLLWALSDGGPLLLEEPELSLHAAVIRYLPLLLSQAAHASRSQTLLSTHSAELLTDEGIAAREVLLFELVDGDTRVSPASADRQIRALIDGGIPVGDAVESRTAPPDPGRILRFAP